MSERDEREVWAREESPRNLEGLGTFALVNGAQIPLTAGASFKDTCLQLSRDAGFGKFRVYLNGSEITPSQAPETLNEGDKMEIRAFDVAGR
jgi:hypothetical protein